MAGIYDFLSSVRFTILLLSLIAVGSIFGTVIKQKAPLEEYLTLYSESTFRFIRFFNLDDTYHSPWFYGLVILFVVNLSLCTLGRFRRFIRSDRKPVEVPAEETLQRMEMHFYVEGKSETAVEEFLRKTYTRLSVTGGAVFEKGALSRYGVFIIHTSIILILLGGFVGDMGGYKGYMVLTQGETKDRISLRGDNAREQALGFSLKCEDFKVAFYPGGEPKDYVSTLKVIDKGKVVTEKKVRVNDPLSYKGIHVYQASYGRTPSFLFNIGGENVILRERETFRKGDLLLMVVRFESAVHDFGPGVLIAYLNDGQPKTSWFLKNVEKLREKDLQGVPVRLENIKDDFYTGLEVSKDPGIWIVWTGFAMMLIGLYVNFFTYHRRIYVRKGSIGVIVAGSAPRRKEAFREEFAGLKTRMGGNES